MQVRETANLLGRAALVDGREVTPEIVAVWHEYIGHLDPRTAMAALDRHRATSDKYLEPAHIIEQAKTVKQIQAHDEAATRARYALPAPKSGGVPDWFWGRAGIDRHAPQPPPWPCPWCGARELAPCIRRGTTEPLGAIHPAREAAPTGAASVIEGDEA